MSQHRGPHRKLESTNQEALCQEAEIRREQCQISKLEQLVRAQLESNFNVNDCLWPQDDLKGHVVNFESEVDTTHKVRISCKEREPVTWVAECGWKFAGSRHKRVSTPPERKESICGCCFPVEREQAELRDKLEK